MNQRKYVNESEVEREKGYVEIIYIERKVIDRGRKGDWDKKWNTDKFVFV